MLSSFNPLESFLYTEDDILDNHRVLKKVRRLPVESIINEIIESIAIGEYIRAKAIYDHANEEDKEKIREDIFGDRSISIKRARIVFGMMTGDSEDRDMEFIRRKTVW